MKQMALTRFHHMEALSLLRSITRIDGRIMDIGCACGDFTAEVATTYPESTVIGLDFVDTGFEEVGRCYPEII